MVDDYYFQLVLDDMPMWGFLGSKEHVVRNDGPRARYWLNTHYHFELRCVGGCSHGWLIYTHTLYTHTLIHYTHMHACTTHIHYTHTR